MAGALRHLGDIWLNQFGATFLAAGSTLSLAALTCTFLLAAILAIPRGRRRMPRLAVWCRALFPRRLWRSASGRADIGYFGFGMLFFGIAFGWAMLSSASIASAGQGVLAAWFGPARPLALPATAISAILTIAFFLAYEFAYWLDHWLSHKIPILWQFHRVHHAAESLSLLTNFRVHPVDTIVFAGIVAVVVGMVQAIAAYLVGPYAHGWEIGGANVIALVSATCLTHLQHSHLWITFGPRWGKLLLGPAHHQIHHSADPRHFDRNFGSALAIFDRLFGTFHMPAGRREPLGFGLGASEPAPHGLKAAIVDPVAGAARIALAGVEPSTPRLFRR